jgi:hypothetical protein
MVLNFSSATEDISGKMLRNPNMLKAVKVIAKIDFSFISPPFFLNVKAGKSR